MDKKIKVAIVGYGNIGRYVLEALQARGLFAYSVFRDVRLHLPDK